MLKILPKYAALSSVMFLTSGIIASNFVLAEPGKPNNSSLLQQELNDLKANETKFKQKRDQWDTNRFSKFRSDKQLNDTRKADELLKRKTQKITFPQPLVLNSPDNSGLLTIDWLALLTPVADLLLPGKAEAANLYGSIAVDGAIADWTANERINLPLDKPPYLATGVEVYGKYVSGTIPVYVFALRLPGTAIGANTTLWLNTDQNQTTGFQIFGAYGGAEFAVNVSATGVPSLVTGAGVISPVVLDYAYSADKSVLEFAVPASALGITTAKSIDVLGDLNESIYFPDFYSSGDQYTAPGAPVVLPTRTDLSKRVGIVFSLPSKNNFYDEKAYSQLYMAMQHQAMMAGIRFDLINEADLADINKLVNYDALIFPYASNLTGSLRTQVRKTLNYAVYNYKIGIITADGWFTNDEANAAFPGDSYAMMKQILGLTRVDGAGPVTVDLLAGDVTHPVMKGYATGESILSSQKLNPYKSTYTSYYQPLPGQTSTTLANQTIPSLGTFPGVIATTTGGRNVHFATAGFMADGPLVWQALQWVVYGSQTPVGLKMGRNKNLFISRNDMDQSQEFGNSFFDDMGNVDVPLYSLLLNWKNTYNFVGSYYINIGNNPAGGQQTVWLSTPQTPYDSKPLYKNYLALGNEMGTHSYTHPADTNILTAAQFQFEFKTSMDQIGTQLNPTWQDSFAAGAATSGINTRGAAVPGAPESVATARSIMQYVDYLSGGGSVIGAGYPSAIGYLTPSDSKVYFSPNLTFDFTMMNFGVPVGVPPAPVRLTAAQAEQFWADEYDRLMSHASQPIVHWPWHDYGPTSATKGLEPPTLPYTVSMFQNTIARAFNTGAEFATLADVANRINTFKSTPMTVTQSGNVYTATVAPGTADVGKFSLGFNLPAGQKIQNVANWYAYNDTNVFLDTDGGTFATTIGTTTDVVTHITEMPMRSKIVNLTGDGTILNLSFEGQGTVKLALKGAATSFQFSSDAGVVTSSGNTASVNFANFGKHTLSVAITTATLPVTVYKDVNFAGVSQSYDVGVYSATAGQMNIIGDNTISSVKVAIGYTLNACDLPNGTGTCKAYKSNNANIATVTQNINDKISYLRITKP